MCCASTTSARVGWRKRTPPRRSNTNCINTSVANTMDQCIKTETWCTDTTHHAPCLYMHVYVYNICSGRVVSSPTSLLRAHLSAAPAACAADVSASPVRVPTSLRYLVRFLLSPPLRLPPHPPPLLLRRRLVPLPG